MSGRAPGIVGPKAPQGEAPPTLLRFAVEKGESPGTLEVLWDGDSFVAVAPYRMDVPRGAQVVLIGPTGKHLALCRIAGLTLREGQPFRLRLELTDAQWAALDMAPPAKSRAA